MLATISALLNKGKISVSKKIRSENAALYILAAPGLLYLFLNSYVPIAGLVVVFKNYNFQDGIFGSPWVGLENFEFFFYSFEKAWRATKNTLLLNSYYMIFGTLFAVALAIMFNEMKSKKVLKITQSITFFPYFISWVVLGGITMTVIDYDKGMINQLIASLGFERINFYSEPGYWPFILTTVYVWKNAGYNALIYYAVLTGLDPSYYESAVIDGATRMQQIKHITIPLLKPTVIILTLLQIGRIFYGDLTMMMGMTNLNPVLFPTTDIIDTFVYRSVIQGGDFSMSSAVGLYQSIFGFLLVMASNYFVGRFDKDYKIF